MSDVDSENIIQIDAKTALVAWLCEAPPYRIVRESNPILLRKNLPAAIKKDGSLNFADQTLRRRIRRSNVAFIHHEAP